MAATEAVVAQVGDLEEGEMRTVTVGGTDVLLARSGGEYHALYGHCTHYGAPLANGALSDGRVVCPWHHACFELATGHHLEPPGEDGLARFEVHTEGEDVIVRVPGDFETHVPPEMARRSAPSGGPGERTFVVLGGGAAGAYAAEAMRMEGFDGRLVMISADARAPYDRTNLSKAYLAGQIERASDIELRSEAFYDEYDIEVTTGREVMEVDAAARSITFEDGEQMAYDALVLAPGAAPRKLYVDGFELDGVFTLRSLSDSDRIQAAAEDAQHAVVVGASFIGMECAASLRERFAGLSITVVAPEAVPFAGLFGERIGRWMQQRHEQRDIDFRLGATVEAFEGENGVERVVLDDGTALPADLVIVGIGVAPATDFVNGLEMADDGGIVVDERLRASLADGARQESAVWAAGDVARFPDWRTGASVRIEHWRLACQHGRLAGRNAAGAGQCYRAVPFFWTRQYGQSLQYLGHAEDWDEVLFDGAPGDEGGFIAFYVQDGQILAAAGLGRGGEMAAFSELMRRELLPAPETLRDGDIDLAEQLHAAAGLR